MSFTVGSLFSGIGGFDLAAERVGFDVKWQVEIDDYCNRVLEKHWPHVRRYRDVRACGDDLERVDLVCGGFPCQDLSSAGKRAGIDGERSGLWRHAVRIIDELRPRCVVLENVHHSWKQWVPIVRRALWDFGYPSLPIRLRASDFGAWHQRSRVYLVAHVDPSVLRLESWRSGWPNWTDPPLFADVGEARCQSGANAVEGGARRRVQRAAAPDAHHARRTDSEGRGAYAGINRQRSTPANVDAVWELQPQGSLPSERRWVSDGGWRPTEPDVVRVVHGVSSRMDGRRVAARIGALGNAVFVPSVEWIFQQIKKAEEVNGQSLR